MASHRYIISMYSVPFQNDKRYLNLEPVAEERKKILMGYIDDLDKKGVPPPPTATEPSRRNIKT